MLDAAGGVDGMVNKVAEGIRKSLSNERMRQQLQMLTLRCPRMPIRAGSTWTRDVDLVYPMPMRVSETYKVTARGSGAINLAYQGVITPSEQAIDLGVVSITADMTGTQKGSIQIDEATGWIRAAGIDVSMAGMIKAGASSTPFKAEGNIYLTTQPG